MLFLKVYAEEENLPKLGSPRFNMIKYNRSYSTKLSELVNDRLAKNRFNLMKFNRGIPSGKKPYVASELANAWSHYFYLRFPKIYRDYDVGTDYQLKRYIRALIEGGFEPLLGATDKLEDLVDPSACPSQFLPLLCETFGIKYFEDIPEIYQRRFLKSIITLYKVKGTRKVIEYIARELSGLTVTIEKIDDEYRIRLNAFEEDNLKLLIEQDVITRYVEQFIPVNIKARVVTSYNFLEQVDRFTTEEDLVFNIIDKMIRETEGSEESYERYVSVNKLNDSYPINDTIDIDLEVDTFKTTGDKCSISNVAIIGYNFYSNIINGIDTINDNGVESEILY